MAEITLAQALKRKARLARRITELKTAIAQFNSVLAGVNRPVSNAALYEEWKQAEAELIQLKQSLAEANIAIMPTILRLAEVRGRLAWLQTLAIQEGPVPSYGIGEPMVYKAELGEEWRRAETLALSELADQLQDELDNYNAATKITVAD